MKRVKGILYIHIIEMLSHHHQSHHHQSHHQQHERNRYNDRENKQILRVLETKDADTLLSNFPVTRLSYEVSIHKNDTQYAPAKNPNHYKYFILPKGKRCIAWATEWNRNRILVIIDIQRPNYREDRRGGGLLNDSERPFIRKFYQENGWCPGKVTIYDACFDRTVVYGTVFGGVMFRAPNIDTPLFSIHTIYWYKANPVPPLSGLQHIALCEELFHQNNIRQVSYTKENSIIFGLPVLCNTEQDAEHVASQLPYEIFSIQYRSIQTTHCFQILMRENDSGRNTNNTYNNNTYNNNNNTYNNNEKHVVMSVNKTPTIVTSAVLIHTNLTNPTSNPTFSLNKLFVPPTDDMLTNIQAVFIIRPNIQNDIYELYVMPDVYRQRSVVGSGAVCEPLFYNFALIPSFKTSVFMNRLFRNISENERLDTMEESEDEADFENTDPDKYVTLSKEYIMLCRFNKRFCKWVPIEIAAKKEIITFQQAKQHEMRYSHRMK
jgi:hypothetical protein